MMDIQELKIRELIDKSHFSEPLLKLFEYIKKAFVDECDTIKFINRKVYFIDMKGQIVFELPSYSHYKSMMVLLLEKSEVLRKHIKPRNVNGEWAEYKILYYKY